MMAKPMKTLESHYPTIQFLITLIIIHQIFSLAHNWSKHVSFREMSEIIPQFSKLGALRKRFEG